MKYEYEVCGCDYGYMEDEVRGDCDFSGPVDLVMWVKDGARTLPSVLSSIENSVKYAGKFVVGQKIVVDDGSKDNSVAIAESFGWKVIKNSGRGISDAANTTLKLVRSKWFCSFEQDVTLAANWFNLVPGKVVGDVVVASGVRLPYPSKVLRDISVFTVNRNFVDSLGLWQPIHHCFGMSLDNTCYNTEFLRGLGGFPKVAGGAGVDRLLAEKVLGAGKLWSVDFSVQSNHFRRGVWDELRHYYWYGKCQRQIDSSVSAYVGLFGRALFSPIRGCEVALRQRDAVCCLVYPAIRCASLAGAVRGLL